MNDTAPVPQEWSFSQDSPFKLKYNNSDYDPFMHMASISAIAGVMQKQGGPFGSTIVKDGLPIAVSNNTVYCDLDPCCHAESNAIKLACKTLSTTDLSDCIIYASGAPCPMCYGAILLTKMKKCFIGVDLKLSSKYTFSDLNFYQQLCLKESERDIKIVSKILSNEILDKIEEYNKTHNCENISNIYNNDNEKYIKEAFNNCNWVKVNDSLYLPFGAVVVKDNKIIGVGINSTLENQDITNSAEIQAIRQACKYINNYSLNGCSIYTIFQPNLMNYSCIMWSRISSITYCLPLSQFPINQFQQDIQHYDLAKSGKYNGIEVINDCMKDQCELPFKLWKSYNGTFY